MITGKSDTQPDIQKMWVVSKLEDFVSNGIFETAYISVNELRNVADLEEAGVFRYCLLKIHMMFLI